MSKGIKRKIVRTTVILPVEVRDAMRVVREVVRVLPSHQIELGLREYLKQHRALLESRGIKL
jgi:hypothetical protein